MEQHPGADALRRRRSVLADSWRGRADGLSTNHANAVLGTLAYALEAGPEAAAEIFRALLDHEPELQLGVEQFGALRTTLQRDLALELPPAEALPAVEATNRLIDALLSMVTERLVGRLAAAALLDPLTGAGNRRALERDAPRELAVARRQESELALVLLDLDGLMDINDSSGHAAGDDKLRQLVDALGVHLREADGTYRIGGDEFVVLLPGTGAAGAAVFVDRSAGDAPAFCFGVASAPADGWVFEDLLALADQRMLDAKRARPRGTRPGHAGG